VTPVEFEVDGKTYQATNLDLFVAFDVQRRILPIFVGGVDSIAAIFRNRAPGSTPALVDLLDAKIADTVEPIVKALAAMSNADSEFVIKSCLAVVRRKENDAWAPILVAGRIAYQDIRIRAMLEMTWKVLSLDILPFIDALIPASKSDGQGST
jgi:hypothetical protein